MERSLGDNTYAKPGFNRGGTSILRLQGEKLFAAQGFLVRLLGICKTSISTGEDQMRKTHECSAVFLDLQKELYSSPTMLQDGFHRSFEIQFPDNPTAKHRFPDSETLNTLLEVPQRQFLPPSGTTERETKFATKSSWSCLSKIPIVRSKLSKTLHFLRHGTSSCPV